MTEEPLRVLVVDDEATARRRLMRLLEAMPDVRLAGECADADEALERIRAGGVDLVLLDVQMPGLSGLDALALWPVDGPIVIFCTAHAEHAVAAFDVGAIDYLLKPVDAGRLRKALDRAREAEVLQRFRAEAERQRGMRKPSQGDDPLPARLPLETRQGIVLLAPAEISHAQLDGALVTVYTKRGPFLCDLTLQDLEASLAPHGFVRVHRRALLNLARVVRLEPEETGGFLARTDDGHAVEVSRQSARDLRKRLGLRR
ncbi:MAG TPA: LytTR family DNA-binding domain-containing protein [Polyangia bacterium]